MVDPDLILEKLRNAKLPTEQEIKSLCDKASEILNTLDNVAELECPITVCGDIHGQFDDLLEIFDVGGEVPETNYIFLGDFVDRGYNSVETFIYLLTLKIKYPNRITLLRGNHESRQITQAYGFYEECQRKYGSVNVWKMCTNVFDLFQLAAVIESKVFCVHGGLSPNPDKEVKTFSYSPRGAGFLFGEEDTNKFNRENNIELIARAHQLIQEGFQFLFGEKLVTVWSAPNYCYRCGNDASVMEYDEHMNRAFKIFEACPENARNQPDKKPAPEYFL